MNDQDQPLGAPSTQTDQQHAEQNQQPQKPKRKLNWKGFGIGIIAVIIIEFFAISMLQTGDPEIAPPSETPTPKPTEQASNSTQPLMSVAKQGGLCPQGKTCASSLIVQANGSIQAEQKETKRLAPEQTQELKDLISKTDFTAMKKKPFTGTCPIAFDGQETIYIFYTENGKQELPSCTYQIDEKAPLFIFLTNNGLN